MGKLLSPLFFVLFLVLAFSTYAEPETKPEENPARLLSNLSDYDLQRIQQLFRSECRGNKSGQVIIFTINGAIIGGLCNLFTSRNNPLMNIDSHQLVLQMAIFVTNFANQRIISHVFKEQIITAFRSFGVLAFYLGAITAGVYAFAVGASFGAVAGMILGVIFVVYQNQAMHNN